MNIFKCKRESDIAQLNSINPFLFKMLAHIIVMCSEHGVTPVITSVIRTPEENAAVGAVSKTHIEGRAIDISIRGWDKDFIKQVETEINFLFSNVGAISASTGKPRPIVVHDVGFGAHIHVQTRRIN